MSFILKLVLSAVLLSSISGVALAQNHAQHTPGMTHQQEAKSVTPTETGQSSFAALAEIVAILKSDPNTDWSTVDIETLREHLIDMDRLTLHARVDTTLIDNQSLEFNVSGDGRTREAIRTMVPTHARMVNQSTQWLIDVTTHSTGVKVAIDTGSPEELIQLKALGFFGFMTIGAHHQKHHLQMALGHSH